MRRVEHIAGALIGLGVVAAGIGITTTHRAASSRAGRRPDRRMAKHFFFGLAVTVRFWRMSLRASSRTAADR
jgi:F0F1-type ATP synthase membrane subunit c/vacuolar-type H+-ATPase subunit K